MSDHCVRKTAIMVTVLSDGPGHLKFDNLKELHHTIDSGDCMGQYMVVCSGCITDPDTVAKEEYSLGGDGSFFGRSMT